MSQGGNFSWKIDLPNGTYKVHLAMGDATKTNVTYGVNANNTSMITTTIATGAYPFVEATKDVSVTGGTLTLSSSSLYANEIDYIDIWPSSTASSAPTAPTGLTATAGSTTSVDLRWNDNADNETSYEIQRSPNNSTWTTLTTTRTTATTTPAPTFPNATNFSDTGLTAGTTYYYRIRAVNANPATVLNSAYTTSVSVATPSTNAQAPYGGTAWSANNRIEAENFDLGGEGVAYHDTTASNNGGEYRSSGVDILDNRVVYAYAGEWQEYTISVPTGGLYTLEAWVAYKGTGGTFHATFTDGGNTLTTSTVTTPDTGDWNHYDPISLGAVNFATAGTKVMKIWQDTNGASGGVGNFDYYQLTSLPAAPINLAATTVSTSQINIGWTDHSNNESDFKIDYDDNAGLTSPTTVTVPSTTTAGTTANLSSPITALAPGTHYYFRMRAKNITGDSANTPVVDAWTIASTPTGLAVTGGTSSSLSLSWDATTGAASYVLLRKGPGESIFTPFANNTTTGTTLTDTGLSPNSIYSYKIQAVNPGGTSALSGFPIGGVTSPNTPATPTGLAATGVTASSVSLSWNSSSGAASYIVLRSATSGGTYSSVGTPTGTSFNDSTVSAATTYYYQVQATNAGGTSAASSYISTTTLSSAPATPSNLTAVAAGPNQIDLAWTNNASVIDTVYIDRAPHGTMDFTLFTLSGSPNSFHDITVEEGKNYDYIVWETAGGYNSTNSNVATENTPYLAPTGLAVLNVTSASSLLSWQPGGELPPVYYVYRDGTFVGASAGTAFEDQGLTADTSYAYTVTAVSGFNKQSAVSSSAGATTAEADPATLPPEAATDFATYATTDSSISLNWQGSYTFPTYEITRNGEVIGSTTDWYFDDTDLMAGTTYTYGITAFDALNNASTTVTDTFATTADETDPAAPFNLAVTSNTGTAIDLSWSPGSDNVAVTGYKVYKNGTYIATTTGTSFTDSSVTAGVENHYEVSSRDAAGNESSLNSNSIAVTPGGAPTVANISQNQFVPDDWQDYFYNTLTPGLRSFDSFAAARGWLDLSASAAGGPDSVILNGTLQSSSISGISLPTVTASLNDKNGNGLYDDGEAVWVPLGSTSAYTAGDPMMMGSAPPVGTSASASIGLIKTFAASSSDYSGVIKRDPGRIQGVGGQLAYRDISGNGQWDIGEPIWNNVNADGTYSTTATTIYNPYSVTLTNGDLGKKNGLYFYDLNHDGWDAGDKLIWADSTATFQEDFGNFYLGMERAITGRYEQVNGRPVPWSVGDYLDSIGAPTTTLSGTIKSGSVEYTGGTHSILADGAGVHFLTQISPGDSILIGSRYYDVESVYSDTSLTLVQEYTGASFTAQTLQTTGWLKVPTDTTTYGFPLTYQTGRPDSTSVVFPQQFQQLRDALKNLKTTPPDYDYAMFDSTSSSSFIATAGKVIRAWEALYGSANDPIRPIILAGRTDPGATYRWDYIDTLRTMVTQVGNVVFVRNESSPQTSGWQVAANGSMMTFSSSWSSTPWIDTDANGDPLGSGSPISAAHLQQIETRISAILANGNWVSQGASTMVVGSEEKLDYKTLVRWNVTDDPNFLQYPTLDVPPDDAEDTMIADDNGNLLEIPRDKWIEMSTNGTAGLFEVQNIDYTGNPVSVQNGGITWYGRDVQVTVPAAHAWNSGGAMPVELKIDAYHGSIDTSGWDWQTNQSILKYTAAELKALLIEYYPYLLGSGAYGTFTIPDAGLIRGLKLSWTNGTTLNGHLASFQSALIETYSAPTCMARCPPVPSHTRPARPMIPRSRSRPRRPCRSAARWRCTMSCRTRISTTSCRSIMTKAPSATTPARSPSRPSATCRRCMCRSMGMAWIWALRFPCMRIWCRAGLGHRKAPSAIFARTTGRTRMPVRTASLTRIASTAGCGSTR